MAGKSNACVTAEWVRAPQPTGNVWTRAGKLIYNSEDKSFLGRTAKRWGIFFVFYMVFYAALALLFAVCMAGLSLSLDKRRPTYTLNKSLIGSSPGVTFRPSPLNEAGVVVYDIANSSHYEIYTHQLDQFFNPYEKFQSLKECTEDDNYGFPDTPCFYLKLNKIIDWNPDPYDGDESPLPEDMPEDLKEHIMKLKPNARRQVWVSCAEESNSSVLEYPWGRGLQGQFPYTNQKGYTSPIIPVKVTPTVDTWTVIRCRLWAKNIVYNKSIRDASGYVQIHVCVTNGTNTTEHTDKCATKLLKN